ncbi:MAG: integrin alpha [Cyanobacteria bacterium P01_F01_bin.3]
MNVEAVLKLAELDDQDGLVISGPHKGSALGRSLSNAGDINADGIDDVIISTQPSENESGLLEL